MNFCLKGHHFSREISDIGHMSDDHLHIYFKNQHPYGLEFIDISPEEFLKLDDNYSVEFKPKNSFFPTNGD